MRINERLEDILVWIFVLFAFIAGYGLLDYLFSSNWFWESLKIIAPVVLVGGVTFTFYQQAMQDYKKTGKKTAFIQIFFPTGVVFAGYLLVWTIDSKYLESRFLVLKWLGRFFLCLSNYPIGAFQELLSLSFLSEPHPLCLSVPCQVSALKTYAANVF